MFISAPNYLEQETIFTYIYFSAPYSLTISQSTMKLMSKSWTSILEVLYRKILISGLGGHGYQTLWRTSLNIEEECSRSRNSAPMQPSTFITKFAAFCSV